MGRTRELTWAGRGSIHFLIHSLGWTVVMDGLGIGENRIPERLLAPKNLANWLDWAIWYKDLQVKGTSSGLSGPVRKSAAQPPEQLSLIQGNRLKVQ